MLAPSLELFQFLLVIESHFIQAAQAAQAEMTNKTWGLEALGPLQYQHSQTQ
jgi:hypothetical protein